MFVRGVISSVGCRRWDESLSELLTSNLIPRCSDTYRKLPLIYYRSGVENHCGTFRTRAYTGWPRGQKGRARGRRGRSSGARLLPLRKGCTRGASRPSRPGV
eukprot:6185301-Pleurochrysis_carterae.AAC.4